MSTPRLSCPHCDAALPVDEDGGRPVECPLCGRSLPNATLSLPQGEAAACPDGKRLASASTDGTIKIWDADSGEWPDEVAK